MECQDNNLSKIDYIMPLVTNAAYIMLRICDWDGYNSYDIPCYLDYINQLH